ncbi:phage protease [Paenibacillus alba]|uniref:Phage protease n=1 Tax=Paenibacillus alba TaxID=1197127 RepID=A0ABU6GF45_9BACL|nr:phage protease [Paenibacillus alba]MEC0231294.1 phage protease [Paenibacillus alba]
MLKIPAGRIGEWKHPRYGSIKMTQQTFTDIIRNFKEKTIGRDPFIRIGHDKADDPTFGSSKAEGWITDIVQEGDHLFALADPTNDQVAEMVRTKQFRYASPEYQNNYQDKESGSLKGAVLEALALTNEPFLTKLPEARLLSDPADTFYLDHEEVKRMPDKEILDGINQTNTLLSSFTTKLSDFFDKFKPNATTTPDPAAVVVPVVSEETKKLAEQVAEQQAQIKQMTVDSTLSAYVAKGIPPAVCAQYKPILLADSGEKVVKLSDDKTISVSEQIYAALDAFPDAARIKFAQEGQHGTPPAAGSPEEVKKLADATMKELGYTITEDGKYKL